MLFLISGAHRTKGMNECIYNFCVYKEGDREVSKVERGEDERSCAHISSPSAAPWWAGGSGQWPGRSTVPTPACPYRHGNRTSISPPLRGAQTCRGREQTPHFCQNLPERERERENCICNFMLWYEKEERKKQARSNKQTRQSNTACTC